MSQKISPTSNKLGITKIWDHGFSKYGQNFKNYVKFIYPRNYIFNYISQLCLKYDLLIENINIFQTVSNSNIEVFVVSLKDLYKFNIEKRYLSVVSIWINSSFNLSFYKNLNINRSSLLINNYIFYLFFNKLSSPKKVLQFVFKVLKNQKKKIQIKYTSKGIKVIELKGFKIEITGCFESSRSQMAKIIKCNFGTIPLTKLNGYVDYSKKTLFTKFGSCGLKVWLFYEFK